MWIGGAVVLAFIGVLVAMNMKGDGQANASTKDAPKKSQPAETKTPAKKMAVPSATTEADKPGKSPDRAAPAIPASVWTETAALFQTAKDKWNEGQTARKAGEVQHYKDAVNEAWQAMEQLSAKIEPYASWFEEADMGGWAMPGDYVRLQKRFNVWDRHSAKIQKIKAR